MPSMTKNEEWRQMQYLGVIAALIVVFAYGPTSAAFSYAREETMLTIAPSADRAYRYGSQHFDVWRAKDYDLNRADRLFHRALQIDATHPFVQHQLARIAFLRGDFTLALIRINAEIRMHPNPSSYYVRGLIRGFMGFYAEAAADYETFLHEEPTNWAGINDYAWVLLKQNRPGDALVATDWGLIYWSDNPWLLNSKATAHLEMGQLELAEEAARAAQEAVMHIGPTDWLQAYPGNDPLIAQEGILAFRKAVDENVHMIALARENSGKNVQ